MGCCRPTTRHFGDRNGGGVAALLVTVLPDTVLLISARVASVALVWAEAAELTWLTPPPAKGGTVLGDFAVLQQHRGDRQPAL